MSTSTSPEMGKILLVDPPDLIKKKVMGAVTDTGREVRRAPDKPGVTNLIDIMSVAAGREPEDIEREYEGQGYGRFKADVAEAVVALLEPIQRRYRELRADQGELERLLAQGARKSIESSRPTLQTMYDRMGFTRRHPD
jgi:tryptophanyl-tRNA synthetase